MGNGQSSESCFLSAVASGDHLYVQNCITRHEKCLTATAGFLNHNQSALHIAAHHGHANILTLLLAPLVNSVTNEMIQGTYPGDAAAALESAINRPDSRGRSPLLIACSSGQWDCADRLLEAGANVLAADRDGNGVLHLAIVHGHLSTIIQLLLKAEEQSFLSRFVNFKNLAGLSPLHYAAWTCNSDIAQQLLLAGADQHISSTHEYDPWLQVPLGTTPLHVAALQNDHDLCYVLLQQHAADLLQWVPGSPTPPDPRIKADHTGRNPLEAAIWRGHTANRQVLACLNPALDLRRLFSYHQLESVQRQGPPSLKTLASAALKTHLLEQLAILKDQKQMRKERRQEQQRKAQELEQKLLLLEKQRQQQQQQQEELHEHGTPAWQRWWSRVSDPDHKHQDDAKHQQQHSSVPSVVPGAAAGYSAGSWLNSKPAGQNGGKDHQQHVAVGREVVGEDHSSSSSSKSYPCLAAATQLGSSSHLHAELLEGIRRTPSATIGAIQYASCAEEPPACSMTVAAAGDAPSVGDAAAFSGAAGAASDEVVGGHASRQDREHHEQR